MKFLLALFTAATALAAGPLYPLKTSPGNRYLVDQTGTPFLIHGDSPWSLISGLTPAEADRYLRDRAAKGFNTLMVNLVEHKFKGPKNRDGEDPFLAPGDFSKPNEKYFAHADWVIRKAGEYGIQVLLAPCYLGYKGLDEGWYNEVLANGVDKLRDYGDWVGRRYKDFDNLLWLMGGDREPEDARAHVEAMALAIRRADPRHLFSAHCAPEHSAADCYPGASWLEVNSTYTYKLAHAMLRRDYERRPAMPFFLIESTYEGEHDSKPQWIRRQAYWALLNGAAGQLMGDRPIWLFDPGWEKALDGAGSRDMERLKALFGSLRWWELVPDEEHRLLKEGWGDAGTLSYAAAARTADGNTGIIYLPEARTVEVNLAELKGPRVEARWFDRRTGVRKPGGRFASQGGREFTTPPGGDWVLELLTLLK